MPQVFHVVQCYKCETFQVHQVKKITKWTCKLCGEKQSLKKVFGQGTGIECREHVQRLNTLRGEIELTRQRPGWEWPGDNVSVQSQQRISQECSQPLSAGTKWDAFVDAEELNSQADEQEDDRYTTDADVYKKSKKRKREIIDKSNLNQRGAKQLEFKSAYVDKSNNRDEFSYGSSARVSFPDLVEENDKSRQGCIGGNHNRLYTGNQPYFTEEISKKENEQKCEQEMDSTCINLGRRDSSHSFEQYKSNKQLERIRDRNVQTGPQREGTRWGMYVNNNEDSEESGQSQELDQFDSRPYIDFDPSEINGPEIRAGVNQLASKYLGTRKVETTDMPGDLQQQLRKISKRENKQLREVLSNPDTINARQSSHTSMWQGFFDARNNTEDVQVLSKSSASVWTNKYTKWQGFFENGSETDIYNNDAETGDSEDNKENKQFTGFIHHKSNVIPNNNEVKRRTGETWQSKPQSSTSSTLPNALSLFTVDDTVEEDFEL